MLTFHSDLKTTLMQKFCGYCQSLERKTQTDLCDDNVFVYFVTKYYSSDNDSHCLKCLSQCVTDCICIARQARLCHTLSLLACDPSYRASVGQFLSLRAHHRGRRRSANHKKSDLLPPSRSLCHFFQSHLPHSEWMTLPFFWGIMQEIGLDLAESLGE